jgi:hypothetical protein
MKTFRFNSDISTAFNSCKHLLQELNCDIIVESIYQGIIEARKPGSLLAFGHNLKITLLKNELTVCADTIGIQVIDWGSNAKIEELFIEKIAEIIQ